MAEFLLLGLGLLGLLASTRQMALWARCSLWALGAVLLAASALAGLDDQGNPVFARLLADAASDAKSWDHAPLWHVLTGNWSQVGAALQPMFLLFLLLASGSAVLALLALTPGEALERLIRPLQIGIIGAMAGAFLALALVALGVGGVTERRVYAGVLDAEAVVDGDTFQFGDMRMRLSGVDAPESDEPCISADRLLQCGARAKSRLVSLVNGKLVICWSPSSSGPTEIPRSPAEKLRESYSRPIVQCLVRDSTGAEVDLARAMVEAGHAQPWDEEITSYKLPERPRSPSDFYACRLNSGLWRRDAEAKKWASGWTPAAFSQIGRDPRVKCAWIVN